MPADTSLYFARANVSQSIKDITKVRDALEFLGMSSGAVNLNGVILALDYAVTCISSNIEKEN